MPPHSQHGSFVDEKTGCLHQPRTKCATTDTTELLRYGQSHEYITMFIPVCLSFHHVSSSLILLLEHMSNLSTEFSHTSSSFQLFIYLPQNRLWLEGDLSGERRWRYLSITKATGSGSYAQILLLL